MGDWNFLGGILEEVHIHSTMVGKIWLTILFIFRMLVLGVAAEDVWNDEQSEFVCNTEQPGCHNVCYDRAFPVSLVRLWVLQVIFVSSPSLAYMGHALYRLRALEKQRQRRKAQLRRELEEAGAGATAAGLAADGERRRLERELRALERRRIDKAPLRGSLLRSYVAHILTRSAVEVGFMLGQYLLYGFRLEPLYKCEREPCPNAVDCFVSRPTEKSFFMVFMQCIAAVSLLLNLLEILHLAYGRMRTGLLDYYPQLRDELDDCYAGRPQVCVSAPSAAAEGVGHKTAAAPPGARSPSPDEKRSSPPPGYRPSAFTPVHGDGKDGVKEAPSSPAKGDRKPKSAGGSDARSPSAKDSTATSPKQEAEPEKGPAHLPPHSKEVAPGSLQLAGGGRKPRRVSAPSSCATLVEGKPATAASPGGPGGTRARLGPGLARPVSRSDPRGPGRSRTPESVEESSSESQHSPRRLFPAHRTSLASCASSRWAATDLRI
ncbi:gap junction protein alpha 9a [Anguilla rostrata]|uniref:gap junction protein alpha 9a n=1 Tax=Anguilla rostrata TaxID=7938 RepID=UPI0030CEC631